MQSTVPVDAIEACTALRGPYLCRDACRRWRVGDASNIFESTIRLRRKIFYKCTDILKYGHSAGVVPTVIFEVLVCEVRGGDRGVERTAHTAGTLRTVGAVRLNKRFAIILRRHSHGLPAARITRCRPPTCGIILPQICGIR